MTRLDNDLISRKALLEALEKEFGNGIISRPFLTAIKNAPTVESEASSRVDSGEAVGVICIHDKNGYPMATFNTTELKVGDLLYTSPPKREWVGLSDDDEIQTTSQQVARPFSIDAKTFAEICLKAKLKELNHD